MALTVIEAYARYYRACEKVSQSRVVYETASKLSKEAWERYVSAFSNWKTAKRRFVKDDLSITEFGRICDEYDISYSIYSKMRNQLNRASSNYKKKITNLQKARSIYEAAYNLKVSKSKPKGL